MKKESAFFIYLLERYAEYKNQTSDKILNQWENLGLTKLIYEMYEIYHSERLKNAFEDIDLLIKQRSNIE